MIVQRWERQLLWNFKYFYWTDAFFYHWWPKNRRLSYRQLFSHQYAFLAEMHITLELSKFSPKDKKTTAS